MLARVGEKVITAEDFKRRAELTPHPNVGSVNGYRGNRALLEMLVGEKLVAIRAEAQGLAQDAELQKKLQFVESQAVLRELYADEILSKVEISEADIQRAFARLHQTQVVKFSHFRKADEAQRFLQNVQQTGSFDAAMRQRFGDDLPEEDYIGNVTWGEVDAALEEAAYHLKLQEISSVVKTARGYFVLQLVDIIENPIMTEGELTHKRSSIGKVLRTRRADVVSSQFVRQFMERKQVVIKGPVFSTLCDELQKRVAPQGDSTEKPDLQLQEPAARALEMFRQSEYWHLPLVTYSGGSFSLAEIVEALAQRDTPLDRRSPRHLRNALRRNIFAVARDLLLAEEGYRRGLDRRQAVQNEVRVWRDYFLYAMLASQMGLRAVESRTVRFSPALQNLQNGYAVIVDSTRLQHIQLTTIPFMAVRPGQWNQFVVPPWPVWF